MEEQSGVRNESGLEITGSKCDFLSQSDYFLKTKQNIQFQKYDEDDLLKGPTHVEIISIQNEKREREADLKMAYNRVQAIVDCKQTRDQYIRLREIAKNIDVRVNYDDHKKRNCKYEINY